MRKGDGRALALAVCVVSLLAALAWEVAPLADRAPVESAAQEDAPAEGDAPDADDASPDDVGAVRSSDPDDPGIEDVSPSATPSDAGLARQLDAYLDASFSASHLPGAEVVVVDGSGVVYARALGDVPSVDAPMPVGSLSKSLTAVCVMQLVEAGEVDLDAPARGYIEDPGSLPAEITVRDLLNQTSGLGYYDTTSQALERAEPGESYGWFSYANANYDLLGKVVEGVSGETYADYLAEHVLAPLGMTRSSGDMDGALVDGESAADALVAGHRNWFGAFVADGFTHESDDDSWGTAASGYVVSSAYDLGVYLRMYLAGGEVPDAVADGGQAPRVLTASSVGAIVGAGDVRAGLEVPYAMGWFPFTWDDGELVALHDGSVEGHLARMVLLPDRGLGVVVMADGADDLTGGGSFFDLADGVVGVVTGDDPEPLGGGRYVAEHARLDLWCAAALVACALPLVRVRGWLRWLERAGGRPEPGSVALRLAPYVAGTAAPLLCPLAWGVPWRDLAGFAPDVACVLVACAVLLALAALRRVASLWRAAARARVETTRFAGVRRGRGAPWRRSGRQWAASDPSGGPRRGQGSAG